jgi:hypothetical protein
MRGTLKGAKARIKRLADALERQGDAFIDDQVIAILLSAREKGVERTPVQTDEESRGEARRLWDMVEDEKWR